MSHSLSELNKIIDQEIKNLDFNKEPINLYKPITYILQAGGKRIRPALFLATCQMFSDADIKPAISTALAFEVFHNFTLIHDDIMDNSERRRNALTVHKKWNVNVGILSGDAMLIEAYRLLVSNVADDKLSAMINLFSQTALEVCQGQQYDMDFETSPLVSFDDYIKMIRLKTAVLLAGALKGGAIIGRASAKDANYLYEFGIGLGLAFQLQDDVLDVYADTKLLGKPIGGDIREGKKTALYQEIMLLLDDTEKDAFVNLYENKQINDDDKFVQIKEFYDKYEISQKVLNRANTFYNEAVINLQKVNIEEEKKQILYDFGKKIMARKK